MSTGKKAIILFLEDLVSYMMNKKMLCKNTLYSYEPAAPLAEEFRESVHNGFNDIVRQATDASFDMVKDKIDHLFNNIVQKNDVSYNTLLNCAEERWKKYFHGEVDLEGYISYCIFMIGIAGRFYRVGATASLDYMVSFLFERFPYEEDSPEMWNRLDRAARNIVRKRMIKKNSRKNEASNVSLASTKKCSCTVTEIEGDTFKEVCEKRDSLIERHFNVCSKLSNESSKYFCDSKLESSERLEPVKKFTLLNKKGSLCKSSVLTPNEILDNITRSRIDFFQPETLSAPETPSEIQMTLRKHDVRPKPEKNDKITYNKEGFKDTKLLRNLAVKPFLNRAFCQREPIQHSELQHMQTISPKGSNLNKLTKKTAGRMTDSSRLASAGKAHGQTVSQIPRQQRRGGVADSESFTLADIASEKTMELLSRSFADHHIADSVEEESVEFPVSKQSPNVMQENATSNELNNRSSSIIDEQALWVKESLGGYQLKSFFENFSTPSNNGMKFLEDSENKINTVKELINSPNEANRTFPHSSGLRFPSVTELGKTLNDSPVEWNILEEVGSKYRRTFGNIKDFVSLEWLNRPKPEASSLTVFGSLPTCGRPRVTPEHCEDGKVTNEKNSLLEKASPFPEAAGSRHFEKASIQKNSPDLPEQENLQSENKCSDRTPELACSDDSSEYESALEYESVSEYESASEYFL